MGQDNMVYLEVPQLLYGQDAELNLMAMLEFVMRDGEKVINSEERARVVDWFVGRYRTS